MRYHEFIERVQATGELDQDEAVRATRATLATLGERIYRTERDNLAAQLPDDLKAYLHEQVGSRATQRDVEHFSLQEFYNRVGARSDVTYKHAVKRAKAVTPEVLEAHGYLDGVRVEKKVNWDVLEKWPEEKLVAVGTERKTKEDVEYELYAKEAV